MIGGSEPALRPLARRRDIIARRRAGSSGTAQRGGSARVALACLIVAVAFPFVFAGAYNLQLAGDALAIGTWVMGLDMLVGYTGLVSFGHAVWLAVGAYTFGYLCQRGWDAVPALVVTVGVAIVLATLLGVVATRTSGLAFAIITLAQGVIVYSVIIHLGFLGGGIGLFGVPLPTVAGLRLLGSERSLYLFALALAALAYVALRLVIRSPVGGFCVAIREDRVRARSIGIEVTRYEVLAFVITAAIGAIGGVAFVVLNAGIGPTQFDWSQSGLALVVLIIGGSGTIYGALIGSLIYVFASNYLTSDFATTWQVYLGGLFVALVLLMPGGVAGAIKLGVQRLREAPP